jgi:hypothetical protein
MEKIAMSNLGEEELTRLRMMLNSRAETRASADVLFGDGPRRARKEAREMINKLFVMAPANITQNPNLQKESSARNVKAFFEKISSMFITDAQRRYPELLKVSAVKTADESIQKKAPNLKNDDPARKIPVRSSLSGGSA